jgi:hypothetical protein
MNIVTENPNKYKVLTKHVRLKGKIQELSHVYILIFQFKKYFSLEHNCNRKENIISDLIRSMINFVISDLYL